MHIYENLALLGPWSGLGLGRQSISNTWGTRFEGFLAPEVRKMVLATVDLRIFCLLYQAETMHII